MRGRRVAQIWYVDFILGFIIFMAGLIIAARYVSNNYSMNEGRGDMVTEAAKIISEELMGPGIPESWPSSDVVSIGLTDGDYILNRSKAEGFTSLVREDYGRARGILRCPYDFLVVYKDRNDEPLNIGGACAIGSPDFKAQFNRSSMRAAYYYYSSSAHYMEPAMAGLGADIYNYDGSAASGDLSDFFDNLAGYDIAVMESPRLDMPGFDNGKLALFVQQGGMLFLSGDVGTEVLNASYHAGTAPANSVATVHEPDAYINFTSERAARFYSTGYMARTNASQGYRAVANYSDGTPAISSWAYGYGKAFYFSDWDNVQGEDLLADMTQAVLSASASHCDMLNVSGAYTDISIVPRFAVLRHPGSPQSADIVKIEVYAWQK